MANFLLTKTPGENNFGAEWYNALDVMNTKGLTTDGVQTLTNKILTDPTINGGELNGTFDGTYTLGGTPTITSPTITDGLTAGKGILVQDTGASQTIFTGLIQSYSLTNKLRLTYPGVADSNFYTDSSGVLNLTGMSDVTAPSLTITGGLTADGTITSQAGVIGETQLYSNPLESLALTGDLTGNEGCYKFGSLSGTYKWMGGVLAPNGKIYGIPSNSTQVLEIGGVSNGKQWWALSNYVNKF